ncbi:MAG: HEAT repeat domain-containing protein [Armatimonadota bacterium]
MLNRVIGIWLCCLALWFPAVSAPVSQAEIAAADIPRLLEIYRDIPQDETGQQLKVIGAIVRRGGVEAEDALCRLLPLTGHQFMKDIILSRLASFRSPSAKMALAEMAAGPLSDSALRALFYVAEPGDDAPCRRILELLANGHPPIVALQLWARCRYRPAEAYVLRLVNDHDETLQSAAIEALGGVGGTASLPVLLEIVLAGQPAWEHY